MKIKILGVKIDNLTKQEALKLVQKSLDGGGPIKIATINAEFIADARKDADFKNILNSFELSVCDGFGPFLMSRILGFSLKQKISGVDFMLDICAADFCQTKKIFFLGGLPESAKKTSEKIKKFCPGVLVESEENICLANEKISRFKPDVLFVAFGHKKQEKWICENIWRFPFIKVAMGVGGAFDMVSGIRPRAPIFFRKAGIEWLWRLMIEPSRFKRIFRAVAVFTFLVFKNKLEYKK